MEWLRIGEVARRSGLTQRALRHYDDLGLLVPSGRSSGDYRLYSSDDLERLLAIQHLKSLGLGLDEVAAALDDPAFDAAATLEAHIAVVGARIAAEQELLARLQGLRDAAGAGWDEVLDVIALTERLRHPDPSMRFRAALEGASAPLDALMHLLRDPEPGVREVATWAVVQQGPAAIEGVMDQLDDPDPAVRHQLAHLLGKIADPVATGPLTRLLDDPDQSVAAKAAFSLGQVGGADAVDALVAHLGRGGATLRSAVVTALGGQSGAVDALVAALGSGHAHVRADAAESLGLLEDVRAADALARVAGDEDEEVRLAALMALGALGTDAALEAIGSHADDEGRAGVLARRLASVTGRSREGEPT